LASNHALTADRKKTRPLKSGVQRLIVLLEGYLMNQPNEIQISARGDNILNISFGLWSPQKANANIISAKEFLSWAKLDLKGNDKRSIGNALGNIKKSIHRRIDEIIFNTHVPFAKDWNWFCTTDAKIKVLKQVGVEYRAIANLITDIRNRYEHKYELPDLEGIRAYLEVADLWLERSIKRYSFSPARIISLPVKAIKAEIGTIEKPAIISEAVFDKISKVIFFHDEERQIIFIDNEGNREAKAYSELTIKEILDIEKKYFNTIFDSSYQFEMIYRIEAKNSYDLFSSYHNWLIKKTKTKTVAGKSTLNNEEHAGEASASSSKGKIKIGRNAPCPCGSGLKYKKCCGKNAPANSAGTELLTVSGGDIDFKLPISTLDDNFYKIIGETSHPKDNWSKIKKQRK